MLAAGGLLLGGCTLPDFGETHPISRQGEDAIKLWQGFFIAGIAVFVFVCILIAWAAFRYHRRSTAIPRQTQYRPIMEIVYTALPVVAVLILFGFTFVTENNVDAMPPNPNLVVHVTGFQWGWRFNYPAQHVTVIGVELQEPQLVLPENETVRVTLHSHDVVHGFYVPALDFSRFVQPGLLNEFTLNLNQLGTYKGQCTQFCGLYHSLMRFSLKVVTPQQFTAWANAHRNAGAPSSISTAQSSLTAANSPTVSTKHAGSAAK